MSQFISLIQAAVIFGTVIMFGCLGEILTEKSGIRAFLSGELLPKIAADPEYAALSDEERRARDSELLLRRHSFDDVMELIGEKELEFKSNLRRDYSETNRIFLREVVERASGMSIRAFAEEHIFKKLGMTRSQALNHYLGVVKEAFDAGIRPRCHLEDITRADFYGFVVPFVNELTELSHQAGIPIKIRMCDTMGYGVPYPGVALPRSVPGIVYGLHHYSDVTSEMLEWHGHNDFYKAVVNATSAWLYGASAVNCSLLGIGERTGNIPLEAMVIEYASLRGTFDGMDPTVITEIVNYYKNELHYNIPPMTPFAGENFNVTKAGIHADGLMKDTEIYNIFDTEKILNRPAEVAISNTSGLAGIAYWINTHFQLKPDNMVTKHDALVSGLKEEIDKQYVDGRTTVMSEDELLCIIDRLAPGRFN